MVLTLAVRAAIDYGDPNGLAESEYDQRGPGFARIVNDRIDIGAYELQLPDEPTLGTIDVDMGSPGLCQDNLSADAVVILGPPTNNDRDPGVVRMRRDANGACLFQVRFQEWDYRARKLGDYAHQAEQVSYLGLQPGIHAIPDGSVWEVGTFEHGGTGR